LVVDGLVQLVPGGALGELGREVPQIVAVRL
jgi:hypothetical protein